MESLIEEKEEECISLLSAETISLITLSLIDGVGSAITQKLLDFFGSAEAALAASYQELSQVMGLTPNLCRKIVNQRDKVPLSEELKLIEKHACKVITIRDEAYPERLRTIFDPPQILYVKGELLPQDSTAISVVGSRRATNYGKSICEQLSRQLAANGFTIVSGFARGIDSIAHREALAVGGRTIAVMGNGLSFIYPAENEKLMTEITASGACISEFPMSVPPMGTNFPRRNRVISGVSLGTLVIEASEKSGSLITARLAVEQGREVFAVPGEVSSKMSKGVHNLIKQGAALVETVEDIIECLSIDIPETPSEAQRLQLQPTTEIEKLPDIKLGDEEQIVWDVLAHTPTHIDEITRLSDLTSSKVSSTLVMLELKGIVQQLPGKMFARKMAQRF